MRPIVVLSIIQLVLVIVCGAHSFKDSDWHKFKERYGKVHANKHEEHKRKKIWEANMAYCERHNRQYEKGKHSYTVGENEFSDLTSEEFVAMMNGYKMGKRVASTQVYRADNVTFLPETVDWREEDYVTEVKNQGQCGSCWAFSATGSLEGQHFNATGKLVSLSEQNLVDCSGKEGNYGCLGGLMDNAFKYIIKKKGIDTEASYPYREKATLNGGKRNKKCHFEKKNIGATMSSFVDIEKGSEAALQSAVATVGPISVAIDASHRSFHLYKAGVYNERHCSSERLDHGVLAVGYGTNGTRPYWLVKNSWGKSWGQDGYIWMSRSRNNQCGIATQASFPVV